jgi:2-keto-4-pentenoate hydratase/2-oxopent-4-enoate/cis-2-oxohex-4-enoate hydratase
LYPSKPFGALLWLWAAAALATPAAGDLARAETVQDRLVQAWPAGERVAGYKSAFTQPAMQQRFGLAAPAMAVLPASGERCAARAEPCVVEFTGYRQPVIELEIALQLVADIVEAPDSVMALLPYISAVMPAIELPELALDTPAPATGLDYIASNIGTRAYLLGAPRLPIVLLQRSVTMRLRRGDAIVLEGDGNGAAEAALQLIRDTLARGYPLRAGQILLSGAVAGMTPGVAGAYVAECGSLGNIEFTVR